MGCGEIEKKKYRKNTTMRRLFGTYTKLKNAPMISKRAKRYNYKKRGGDPEKRGGFKKRFAEFDRKMETSLAEIESEAKKSSLPFRTVASVLLERTPVINKLPEPFEVAYEEMRQKRTEGTHHLYVPENFYEKKRSYDESMEQAKQLVAERRTSGENVDVQDETLRSLIWELEFEPAKRTTENDDGAPLRRSGPSNGLLSSRAISPSRASRRASTARRWPL